MAAMASLIQMYGSRRMNCENRLRHMRVANVITGQEALESHKKLHLDLFKKTVSGDGFAGHKPYGYTTRMFQIVGWKRLEVNKMMKVLNVVGLGEMEMTVVFFWEAIIEVL